MAAGSGGATLLSKRVSDKETARHRATAAVAKRVALTEATILLDHEVKLIEKTHRGRAKGSVTARGQEIAAAVKRCADKLWALHATVEVPRRMPGDPYVPGDVFERHDLERAVERISPGIYPQHAALARGATADTGGGDATHA